MSNDDGHDDGRAENDNNDGDQPSTSAEKPIKPATPLPAERTSLHASANRTASASPALPDDLRTRCDTLCTGRGGNKLEGKELLKEYHTLAKLMHEKEHDLSAMLPDAVAFVIACAEMEYGEARADIKKLIKPGPPRWKLTMETLVKVFGLGALASRAFMTGLRELEADYGDRAPWDRVLQILVDQQRLHLDKGAAKKTVRTWRPKDLKDAREPLRNEFPPNPKPSPSERSSSQGPPATSSKPAIGDMETPRQFRAMPQGAPSPKRPRIDTNPLPSPRSHKRRKVSEQDSQHEEGLDSSFASIETALPRHLSSPPLSPLDNRYSSFRNGLEGVHPERSDSSQAVQHAAKPANFGPRSAEAPHEPARTEHLDDHDHAECLDAETGLNPAAWPHIDEDDHGHDIKPLFIDPALLTKSSPSLHKATSSASPMHKLPPTPAATSPSDGRHSATPSVSTELDVSSLARLQGSGLLNDAVIDMILELFASDEVRLIHIVPPTKDEPTAWHEWSLKSRYTLNPCISRVVVPIHRPISGHWALLCFDLVRHEASYFDSLVLLGEELVVPITMAVARSCGLDWQRDHWSVAPAETPQQRNSHDCGVYVVVLAIFFMTRFSMPQSLDASLWRIIWTRAFQPSLPPLPDFLPAPPAGQVPSRRDLNCHAYRLQEMLRQCRLAGHVLGYRFSLLNETSCNVSQHAASLATDRESLNLSLEQIRKLENVPRGDVEQQTQILLDSLQAQINKNELKFRRSQTKATQVWGAWKTAESIADLVENAYETAAHAKRISDAQNDIRKKNLQQEADNLRKSQEDQAEVLKKQQREQADALQKQIDECDDSGNEMIDDL